MAKRTGQHPSKALTSVRVNALKKPGRYADGGGLFLVVDPSGAKRWLLRTVVHGRRRDIGLGGLSLVTLAEARGKALEMRKIARDGGDPLAERRQAKAVVPTFAEAAERVHADHKASGKNDKHAAQWITTLRAYALPHLGSRPVNSPPVDHAPAELNYKHRLDQRAFMDARRTIPNRRRRVPIRPATWMEQVHARRKWIVVCMPAASTLHSMSARRMC